MPCNKEKRGNSPQTGLRRLPRDFSWQLLSKLSEVLLVGDEHELAVPLRSVLRKKDPNEYHALRKCFGLQRMNQDTESAPYNVAISRLLAEICSKTKEFETRSPAQRKEEAIANSLALDSFPKLSVDPVLEMAKQEIARLLPPVDIDQITRHSRHGPGKTVLPHIRTSSYFKYAAYPYSVTPSSKAMLCDLIRSDGRWYGAVEASYRSVRGIDPWRILPKGELFEELVLPVPYNRIVTVPKDGSKDRTIAIEPVGNVLFQLGVDGVFRHALRRWGIDLNSQEKNRRLAHLGSASWNAPNWRVLPATLDLSNASDRISRELVEFLLPRPWFELLDRLRAPYGRLPDGTMWIYHRMSSMGNGATFALETLIFASIIRAVSKSFGRFSSDSSMIAVYGDDCTYPAYLDTAVRRYFEHVGFIVNATKSFSSGPVRESCGCDFYRGHDVRAVYIPYKIESLEAFLALRNGLVLWWRRCLGTFPPSSLLSWLDSYLDCSIGIGPPLAEHRSEYRFGNINSLPIITTRTVGRVTDPIRAQELGFRKLMHPLLSCTSDGGSRFDVSDRSLGTLVVASRRVFCYQAVDYPQASAVPEHVPMINGGCSLQQTPV